MLSAAKSWIALGILVVCFGAGWQINGWRLDARHQRYVAAAETLRAAAQEQARAAEQKSRDAAYLRDELHATQDALRQERVAQLNKKVINYAQHPDTQCSFGPQWVLLDTAAASGRPVEDIAATSRIDAAASTISAVDVLAISVERADAYHDAAGRLTQLQAYVQEQISGN